MEKSIRVRILSREYPLIVREEDEALAHEMAAHVETKMRAFKKSHPEQPDLVAAVVAALALAEELYSTWEQGERALRNLDSELGALDRRLAEALSDGAATNGAASDSQAPGEDAQAEGA